MRLDMQRSTTKCKMIVNNVELLTPHKHLFRRLGSKDLHKIFI